MPRTLANALHPQATGALHGGCCVSQCDFKKHLFALHHQNNLRIDDEKNQKIRRPNWNLKKKAYVTHQSYICVQSAYAVDKPTVEDER
jgi:hypothetical protein